MPVHHPSSQKYPDRWILSRCPEEKLACRVGEYASRSTMHLPGILSLTYVFRDRRVVRDLPPYSSEFFRCLRGHDIEMRWRETYVLSLRRERPRVHVSRGEDRSRTAARGCVSRVSYSRGRTQETAVPCSTQPARSQ